MTFINEYTPEKDKEKYNFAELNKRSRCGGTIPSGDWTIDRANNIWIHQLYVESDHTEADGGYTGVSVWDYYWKGYLMSVRIKLLECSGKRGQDLWARKKLLDISLPSELEDKRDCVLKDLELALSAFKENGVLSTSSSYKLVFEL